MGGILESQQICTTGRCVCLQALITHPREELSPSLAPNSRSSPYPPVGKPHTPCPPFIIRPCSICCSGSPTAINTRRSCHRLSTPGDVQEGCEAVNVALDPEQPVSRRVWLRSDGLVTRQSYGEEGGLSSHDASFPVPAGTAQFCFSLTS